MRNQERMVVPILILAFSIVGCEDRDERLVQFAEQAAQSQRQQNETIARQSERVVQESHELAEAAKYVVVADAQARGEMIQAQRDLHHEIHSERSNVDRQREKLDDERRDLAAQRHRDPLIAAVLQTTGLLIACLSPLVLAGFALWQMNRQVDTAAELSELLIDDLTRPQPQLLPPLNQLLLTNHGNSGASSGSESSSI